MKRISYYLSAILAVMFLSCDEKTPEDDLGGDPDDTTTETPVSIEITGEASWTQFIAGADLSRATLDGDAVAWSDYESFRLYSEADKKTSDTKMSFGKTNGSATATFAGMVPYVEGSRNFWAVYPYSVGSATADSADVYPVGITASQNSNDAVNYLIGVASAASFTGNPGAEHPLTLQFRLVPALWDVNITNDKALSVKSVKVMVDPDGTTSTAEPFITTASINLKKDYSTTALSVTPVTYSASVSTAFPTARTDASLKATFFLLPGTVTGDLKLVVTLDDASVLRFPLDGFNQAFASGSRYTSNINLDDAEEDEPEPEPDPDFDIVGDMLVAYYGAGGDIKIPDQVTVIKDGVNSLGNGIFQGNMTITSVDLNNVVTIGINAFKEAKNITYVNAPNLETVREEGFHGLTSMTEINAPKLKTLYSHAFRLCNSLKTLDLSNVTELIGSHMFYSCALLEHVDLASFAGSIPFQAFANCSQLLSVNLPLATAMGGTDAATSNRGQVFAGCNLMPVLDLPEVTVLSWRAINSEVPVVNVPKVTTLQPQALAFLPKVRYISLPSLVEIKTNQFYNNISGASIPEELVIDLSQATGLTTVAADAFPDIDADGTGKPINLSIYVASEEKKALFPAYTKIKLFVGTPPGH
jgi:hypothetical protein